MLPAWGWGVTYGLIAALAWGISTIAAARAARQIGTYAAVLASQLLGAVILGLLAAVMRPPLGELRGGTLAGLVAGGLLGLAGWLTYYRALEVGQIGVVGAIASTYGGVAAGLAVLFLGERLAPAGNTGIILAIAGVCLAAGQSAGSSPRGTAQRSGILLAAASAVTYGVGSFLLGGYSARAGWLAAALVSYGSSVAALVLALPFWLRTRRGRRADAEPARVPVPAAAGWWPPPVHHDGPGGDWDEPAWLSALRADAEPARVPVPAAAGWWPPPVHHDGPGGDWDERGWALVPRCRRPAEPEGPHGLAGDGPAPPAVRASGIAWAAAAGLTEAAALAAFSRGGEAGQVMVTAAVASLYPVIPLAAGVMFFGERPRWSQVLGVAFIVIGLILISSG